jgi:hypothetical protein
MAIVIAPIRGARRSFFLIAKGGTERHRVLKTGLIEVITASGEATRYLAAIFMRAESQIG